MRNDYRKNFYEKIILLFFQFFVSFVFAKEVDLSNAAIANAQVGDFVMRNGEKIILKQADIDYAKALQEKYQVEEKNHLSSADSDEPKQFWAEHQLLFFVMFLVFLCIIIAKRKSRIAKTSQSQNERSFPEKHSEHFERNKQAESNLDFSYYDNDESCKCFDDAERQQRKYGKIGENLVAKELEKINGYKKILRNRIFICFNDFGNEYTTEIDSICICVTGIFVIEVKYWQGKVYGEKDKKKWKQKKDDGTTAVFDNPIKQNENHVDAIKRIFRNENISNIEKNIVPLLCFVKDNEGDFPREKFVKMELLAQRIKTYTGKLTEKQIGMCYAILLKNSNSGNSTMRLHQKQCEKWGKR